MDYTNMYEALKQALRTFEARGIEKHDSRYLLIQQALAKAETNSPDQPDEENSKVRADDEEFVLNALKDMEERGMI